MEVAESACSTSQTMATLEEAAQISAVFIARNVIQNAVIADRAFIDRDTAFKHLCLLTCLPLSILSTLHGKESNKTTTTLEPDVILRHICSFCTATPLEIMLKLQF